MRVPKRVWEVWMLWGGQEVRDKHGLSVEVVFVEKRAFCIFMSTFFSEFCSNLSTYTTRTICRYNTQRCIQTQE